MKKLLKSAAVALAVVAGFSGAAFAKTTIHVFLWDDGANMQMKDGLGINEGGNMSRASMGVTASIHELPAGQVTFDVMNTSTGTVHEMIVVPFNESDGKLPYLKDQSKVDEKAADHLGEVSETDPGKRGTLTLTLAPGKYALLCNIPGHYESGMWTVITVLPGDAKIGGSTVKPYKGL